MLLLPMRGELSLDQGLVGATLETDQGPVPLTVALEGDDPAGVVPGAVPIRLVLPALPVGTYRAQFVDLSDGSAMWRFRVGDAVVRVVPGAAPRDLEVAGVGWETHPDGGSAIGPFDVQLRNATGSAVRVTGVETEIPGLPVAWRMASGSPPRLVTSVLIAPGKAADISVGASGVETKIRFALATSEFTYRVGAGPTRRLLVNRPVSMEIGVGGCRQAAIASPARGCWSPG